MEQHRAEGRISIQCLEGELRIHLPNTQKAEMAVGDVLVLDCGIPHDVEALAQSAFLLTICWASSHKKRARSSKGVVFLRPKLENAQHDDCGQWKEHAGWTKCLSQSYTSQSEGRRRRIQAVLGRL